MPNVYTWVNREEYKALKKRAETYDITPYALLKELVLIEIEKPPRKRP